MTCEDDVVPSSDIAPLDGIPDIMRGGSENMYPYLLYLYVSTRNLKLSRREVKGCREEETVRSEL